MAHPRNDNADADEDDEVVEKAIRQLHAGIEKIIGKRERKQGGVALPKLRQRAGRLVRHIRHVFLALRQNQRSLTLGLACLDRRLPQHNNKEGVKMMDVRLAFATLLRLHDGYILTVSGECRHAGDRTAAQSTPFPSRLHDNPALYTPTNVYSGTAWDEWNDAVCGLRTRLCGPQLLRIDYDALVEPGRPAAVFEDMVSQTEQTLIGMQSDFTRLKAKMERVYSAKIVWRDRMEQLIIMGGGGTAAQRVQLERVGSQFQVHKALGVCTMEEWEVLMKPRPIETKEKTKKKKRIIVDSDDDNDDNFVDETLKKPTTETESQVLHSTVLPLDNDHGLQVKITEPKKDTGLPQVNVSVNEIKQTMGVDIQQLEAARMEVEGEEEQARIEADAIDDAEPELSSDEAKRRVKRARKAYERALLHRDDTEVWNARELLREELMRAGDILLSSTATTSAIVTTTTTRKKDDREIALSYFDSAAALVRSQQQLDQKLGHDPYFALNLLLLLCRAKINIALACLQLAERYLCRSPRREEYLQRACQEAEAAIQQAQQMSQASEDCADLLRAFQLHALAMRNKGVALWHLQRRKEAQESFQAAGTSPSHISPAGSTEDDPILLECQLERYNAWTTFADLAIGVLERADVTAIRENETFYSEMFQMVQGAMFGASSASSDIRILTDEATDVTSPDELERSRLELETWWKERKNMALLRIDTTEPRNVTRGDVSLSVGKAPTRRFVIGASTSTAKPPTSKITTSNGQRHYKRGSTQQPVPRQHATVTPRRRYRKWREDMVLDESTGKWVPQLEYPAVAPPLPLEFAAILAARRTKAYHQS
jgi:hypothetical protein